ncbi:MAG: sulfotransferase [Gammaproteobacteria bacterium]
MNNCGIFIVGCPRSGTTLLQSMLASHSEIYSAPETSFFSRIIPRLGVEYSDPGTRIDRRCLDMVAADFREMTGIELPAAFMEQDTETDIRSLFENLLASFNKDDKPLWVEKTTLHARHMLAITRFYPEARFINLIRDPVACVGSMSVIRPTSPADYRIRYLGSLHNFAKLWDSCVGAVLEFPHQEQVLHLRYETLVEQPRETVNTVCGFLGIAFQEAMLDSFHHSAAGIFSDTSCPWQKGNLSAGVSKESLYKWRRRLGPAKTWLVQRYVLGHALMLGYYEENLRGSAISVILVFTADQLMRLLAASRIELILRRLFTGKTS